MSTGADSAAAESTSPTELSQTERLALRGLLGRLPYGGTLGTIQVHTVADMLAVLEEYIAVVSAHETVCQARERRIRDYDDMFSAARRLAKKILDGGAGD